MNSPKHALALPPDVVGAIFQYLKPAGVLDAAPTAKAWAEAGECEENAAYMLQACRGSCNACEAKVEL